MKINNKEYDSQYIRRALFCITIGTISGLFVYELFLYFNIAIFGWNLGLIFAPLSAGYVETVLANRIIGENLGAKSAFILFVDTTIYSFIIKNPTLGLNIITVGSIFVILQAAFPTLINHIILVVIGGFLSKILGTIKKNGRKIKNAVKNRNFIHWEVKETELKADKVPYFDEFESNRNLNSLNFFFLTSSDMNDINHEIINIYQSEVIIERHSQIIHPDPERSEKENLILIKEAKDECLIKLAGKIKKDGGNGVLDLSMNYTLIGLADNDIQITAHGMGIRIEEI